MQPQPPGPGWWQASDGRWYPPQPVRQAPPGGPGMLQPWQPPGPPPRSRNRGCVIAAVVVVVLVLAGGGFAIYLAVQAVNKVSDLAQGGGIIGSGEAICPVAGDVSAAVGSAVTLELSGTLVGSTGCTYLAVDKQAGADVQITIGPEFLADEALKDFAGEASAAQVSSAPIPVGQRGQAWTYDTKSAAIAVGRGHLVVVEIMSANSDSPIGDKRDAAISLLGRLVG